MSRFWKEQVSHLDLEEHKEEYIEETHWTSDYHQTKGRVHTPEGYLRHAATKCSGARYM